MLLICIFLIISEVRQLMFVTYLDSSSLMVYFSTSTLKILLCPTYVAPVKRKQQNDLVVHLENTMEPVFYHQMSRLPWSESYTSGPQCLCLLNKDTG